VLAFEGVTRRFRARKALDDVSFRLAPGSFTALTGANGAGKTTLLRLAAALDSPTAGRVALGASVGWLGPEPGLYDDLTARENLAFVAGFFGRSEDDITAAAAHFGIEAALDARARALSRGEKQRVALARASLAGDLMLLDEPTTGLDAEGAELAARALLALRGPRTILAATHDPALVAKADRVLRLEGGRLA